MAALKRNKVLITLDLGYCYLGRNGGREIAGRTSMDLEIVVHSLLLCLHLCIADCDFICMCPRLQYGGEQGTFVGNLSTKNNPLQLSVLIPNCISSIMQV